MEVRIMKKTLLSLALIVLVGVLAIGATIAQFEDTETSEDNTFTAGTLDLKVNDQDDPSVIHVVKENMVPKPNWTYQGYNQQFNLKNAGSVPGTVSWTIKNVENYENDCNEPEDSLGDITCTAGSDQGELGQYTWVQWSRNQAPWGSFGPQFNPFNTAADVEVTGPVLAPGETLAAYMWLDFPLRADNLENLAQGDNLEFDIEFRLEQTP